MNDAWNQLSPVGRRYMEGVDRAAGLAQASDLAVRIVHLVDEHDRRRRRVYLNMNAAESTMSHPARRLLDSELATRVAEGAPGDRIFPVGPQNETVDELEALIVAQARRLFRAEFVEWRATSTTMANTAVLFALTQPGDALLVQSMEGGGNMSYHDGAIPSLRGLVVKDMPIAGTHFEIDIEGVRRLARQMRPAMLIVGGSYVLFPYPVGALRQIADEVGAILLYDAAHVALLIAAGLFQDPLGEGAHLMTMSTHKIMGGPVGGLIVTNLPEIATPIWRMPFPPLMQTRDQNKYAATAFALTEMSAFGIDYARQMIANAKALGAALMAEGLTVHAAERGYTMTHQIFLDATAIEGRARRVERLCRDANLLFQASHMCGDAARGERTGLRLSVQEITRLGMREADMRSIAGFVRRAVLDGEPPAGIASEVAELASQFTAPQYTFTSLS